MAERSCALKDKPERQTLLEVQDYFDLPSAALVEKDWHVIQALAAIRDAASDGLTLAFGGGTALGRAYGLLRRMSEWPWREPTAPRGWKRPVGVAT